MQYQLSPMFKVTRLDEKSRVLVHAGTGDARTHLALEGAESRPLLQWLLSQQPARTSEALTTDAAATLGMPVDDARALVTHLIENGVLAESGSAVAARRHIEAWGPYGWRDAADFHLATAGLRFIPDQVDGLSYEEYFSRMVDDVESAGEQPAPTVPVDGPRLPSPGTRTADASLDKTLSRAMPINRFTGPPVTLAGFLPPLREAFGVQRTVGGLLGPHHLRSYPSGGARHPFEAYVVSKGLTDLPEGVYYFDPITHELVIRSTPGDAIQIDTACFGKGGIVSADAVVVLTCRWLRHSWKYRYARSYRMLMLEVGHIVQAVHLAMRAHDVGIYHCPSIDDRLLRQILELDDDCAEGPVYALGLGHEGVR